MQEYLRRLLKDKARLRKWKRIMIALSCIVVVCTVYALSLPAQTLTCDKEEHTHTAECYDENNALICEKEEHTHTDDCNKQEEVNEQEEVVNNEPETQNDDEQVSQESEEEETTTTTTTETTTEPFDLSSEANKDKITSVVMYYKDADDKWQNLDKGDAKPNSTELYLKVEFDKINTKNLLEQHNGILLYSLPDFMRDFEKAGNGTLLAGDKNIGTIEIEKNKVKFTLDQTYLKGLVDKGSNQLNGSFYVKGQIDLTKINQNNGEAKLVVGDKTVTLNYGPDCIEKFGSVDMKKEMSNVDKVNNYLTYTVTVTAGKDGCKDEYVVDKFTSNANLVSYAGNISSTETTLTSEDNNKDPFETIISGATHGKIYKASIPDATTKIPDAGVSDITNPCIVWHIGDMKPNESRTLTYYVKLNDKANLSGQTIKNNASLYSKSSKDIYEKKVDDKNRNAEFTPKIDYSNQFTKTVNGNITRNSDGSYTIPFKSFISIHEATSNYTIKNFQFYDYLKHDMNTEIDVDLLQYIHFDRNSFKLYMNNDNDPVDSSQYNIKWSTDNTNFKEWSENDNFRSFLLSGNKNNPINLSPGESCYITYSVTVKPEAFAQMHTDTLHTFNRFIAHADNVDKRDDFAGGFEAWNSISNIKTYEWNGKQVEQTATTSSKIETMSGDRFIYENNKIIKDLTSNTNFTIPEGSYKYTVETNKTLNDFNVNEVTMTDTLTSIHMKYVGYMKVEALEADSISRDLNKGTNDTYTLNSNYTPVDTKWIKIDDQQSFSLKPSALGWTDKNYAYRFTYYAKPDNLDTFTETKVKNKFTLEGVVKKGDGTITTFDKEDVSRETTLTIKGNLNLNANKQSWYYKEPDSNTWTNGELYWVVDIGGTQINKDMVFRDLIKTGDGITPSNLRQGSLVGIYKGTLPEGKNISDYKDIEDLKNNSGLAPIDDKFNSQLNGTNELLLTAKENIGLGNEKVYMIIKSEPSELPSPTNNRDTKTYKNSIYIKEDGEYVSEIPAEKTLYTSPKILKELGQVFKYDGTKVTTLQIGADKKNNGDADPSKIDTNLLNKSRGVFISWAFKVNYDGQLSGAYDVIDDIPDGMEFTYMRVKWHGDDASLVTSKKIDNLSGWEFNENDSTNDNNNPEHTIYYVSKDKKQTKIRLGEFVSKSIRDNNSVDVQIVCRITDPQVLLGAQSNDFINKVTLQKEGKNIATSSSKVPVKLTVTDKNINKKLAKKNGQKLEFEINTNQLGQTLPTNDNGELTLVDRLGDNLKLDTTSVKVFNSNNEELTNCKKSYQNNILEIKIPNNIPIKITYTATVNAKPGDSVNIANTAYWKGYSENGGETVQERYSYNVSGTIGASSVVNFKLTKQDENDIDKVLNGATFKIDKCTIEANGDITASEISTANTDANGTITKNLQYDTLYKITETTAPDGYVLNKEPIYIFDVYKAKDSDVDPIKQYLKNADLRVSYQEENFSLNVMNHKGEITVVKKFINDAAGKSIKPVSGTYRFGLYDDPNKLDKPLQPPKTITYSANDTQDKSVKFENLELNKTYYVYELDDQDKPITDISKEVTINTMNYQVVYEKNGITLSSEKNSETIVVTNKSRTKILPSTGSIGTLIYRLLGATLVVASIICLSNINKKNRKENRRKK